MASNETQLKIIEFITTSPKTVSIKEVSEGTGISGPTVRTVVYQLVKSGVAEVAPKLYQQRGERYFISGKTGTDALANSSNSVKILFNGQIEPLRDVFLSWAKRGSVPSTDPFLTKACTVVLELYKLSAEALDENEPKEVNYAKLMNLLSELNKLRAALKVRDDFIRSLVNNEDLWDKNLLPRSLIVADPELSRIDVLAALQKLGVEETP